MQETRISRENCVQSWLFRLPAGWHWTSPSPSLELRDPLNGIDNHINSNNDDTNGGSGFIGGPPQKVTP